MQTIDYYFSVRSPWSYLGHARFQEIAARHGAAESREAVERGIFGMPTYVLGDEIFWGQDRLDFLDRALGG